MRMSARNSAASRGEREEKGLAPSAELAELAALAEFADGEFEVVSLTLVGVCCANAGQATNKTSGMAKRVNRLIARLLLFRAPEPTAEVSGYPQASCLTQRYQKSCPEAPFSFRRRGWRGAGLARRPERRVWPAGRADSRRLTAEAADCCLYRTDARASWRAKPPLGRRTLRWARCPR